jgi:hypothetical protein
VASLDESDLHLRAKIGHEVVGLQPRPHICILQLERNVLEPVRTARSNDLAKLAHPSSGDLLAEEAVARSTEVINELVDLPQVTANPGLEILGLDELRLHLLALSLLGLLHRLRVQLFVFFYYFCQNGSRPRLLGIVGVVLVIGVFIRPIFWIERRRAVLFGVCRGLSFERVCEDVAIVEEPAEWKLFLKCCLHSRHSGQIEENAFFSFSVSRLRPFLLFSLRLLLALVAFVIFSFLALLSKILGIVLILRNGLFVAPKLELIGIVKHLYEPV